MTKGLDLANVLEGKFATSTGSCKAKIRKLSSWLSKLEKAVKKIDSS